MDKHPAPAGSHNFGDAVRHPGPLDAADAARILGSVGDVTLIVAADGRILDASVTERELSALGIGKWIGQAWADTVTIESRVKVSEMLGAAGGSQAARWRQVNHPTSTGDVPVRYLTLPLGNDGRLIAIGRDMRSAAAAQQRLLQTQQALERDYLRLRQTEARYRLLFDMAQEAVLIVDAETRRIREANPAAHRFLGLKDGTLVNQPATVIVDPAERESLLAYFGAAEASDDAAAIATRSAHGYQMQIAAHLFRQARTTMLLLRLQRADGEGDTRDDDRSLETIIERMPDAFVIVDRNIAVVSANAAFLELADIPTLDRARGLPLATWLGRPGIDLDLMLTQLREHEPVRNLATILRGAGGSTEEVEVSAVTAADGATHAFVIRNIGRRLQVMTQRAGDAPRSVDQLTELVGRMSLKEIVRESTDLIERLCIEAALAHTDDNRASAAEILGVSRQSLYSKLHRHGLGSLVNDEN